MELKFQVLGNRVPQKRTNTGRRLTVALRHAFAKAVRLRLTEQGRANIVRPGDDQDVFACGEPSRDRVEIGDERSAVSFACVSQQAKEMVRPQPDGHFCPCVMSLSVVAANADLSAPPIRNGVTPWTIACSMPMATESHAAPSTRQSALPRSMETNASQGR